MLYRVAIAGMMFTTMSIVAAQAVHARRRPYEHARGHAHAELAASMRPSTPRPEALVAGTSIITVSEMASDYEVARLVKLSLDEHVHAINGVIVDEPSDAYHRVVEAAANLGTDWPIDIAIDGPEHERRILVMRTHAPVF
jgi:hypothetical protein